MSRRGCAKRAYTSWVQAMNALLHIQRRLGTTDREQHAYQCPRCRNWHLTSQPQHQHL